MTKTQANKQMKGKGMKIHELDHLTNKNQQELKAIRAEGDNNDKLEKIGQSLGLAHLTTKSATKKRATPYGKDCQK